MTQTPGPSSAEELVTKLRDISVFADLPHEDLLWFISQCEERRAAVGEIIMREGEHPDFMMVMLEGEMRARAEHGSADGPVFTITAGDVTGMLPFSRLKVITVTGRAVLPSHFLGFRVTAFPELFRRMPELTRRLVGLLTDRVRSVTRRLARLLGPPARSRPHHRDRPRRLRSLGRTRRRDPHHPQARAIQG